MLENDEKVNFVDENRVCTMSITSIMRQYFRLRAERTLTWGVHLRGIQLRQLRKLLEKAADTEYGRKYDFKSLLSEGNDRLDQRYSESVPRVEYEDIRAEIERMLSGEKNILWPGICRDFAQSSGTSGGKSKFIPITADALRINHYAGGTDAVAHYLRLVPESHLFDGRSLILGGSFANELHGLPRTTHVGDLSATLIRRINPLANLVRVPSRKVALMADWTKKLPLMANEVARANVTNISGVPSWMLTLLREVMKLRGTGNLLEVWPGLEVFFHGGISFEPYRHEYASLMQGANIHYLENYNASEGFFAVQNDFDDPAMLLLIDCGIFFEFAPLDGGRPLPPWEVETGKTYELLISACNGLWRYSPGDTVYICSLSPLKIKVAGRTNSYINAFGEEVMQWNADRAIAEACSKTGAMVKDYTVAPLFSHHGTKARHQWLIEWVKMPDSIEVFSDKLDSALQSVNSDYQAKRAGDIFLDEPEIVNLPVGSFDLWLAKVGNRKLGGQRKIPRLSNDRHIADSLLAIKAGKTPVNPL